MKKYSSPPLAPILSEPTLPIFSDITKSLKPQKSPSQSPKSLKQLQQKPKKPIWKATQKEINEWRDELQRINKEELSIKKTLKELNLKYQQMLQKKIESPISIMSIEDKKQKELERSLIYIDSLLKNLRKKKNNGFI
jgi:predicted RNase H-like nuclease (RuvC/YqgF family)